MPRHCDPDRAPRRSARDTARTRSPWARARAAGRWTPPAWWPDVRAARPPAAPTSPNRNAGRPQVRPNGLATDARGLLNAPKRPAQAAQGAYLLLFLVVQDVAHARVGTQVPRRRQRLGRQPWWPVFSCPSMAGFGCPPRRLVPVDPGCEGQDRSLARRSPPVPTAQLARARDARQGCRIRLDQAAVVFRGDVSHHLLPEPALSSVALFHWWNVDKG